jgi:mRNA interferase RelE/StbE
VAAALQIWSPTFSKAFDSLPSSARETVQRKVDEMGARLESFAHKRLEGRPEFKLRVGDYRVLYEFDLNQDRIYLHYVGHRRDIYKRTSNL